MKITGGIVSYEDGIKTVPGDQYSPTRKVRVELNFSVDDGDDADVSLLSAMNKAQAMVHDKLNITAPSTAAKRTTTKKPDETSGPTVGDKQEQNVKNMAAASKVTAKVISDKEKLAQAAGIVPAKDPAAVEDETSATVTGEESLDDIMGAAVEPITDKDLTDAVQARNKTIKNPVAIRGVVFEFNGGPGHEIKDIPQEKRAAFLEKLKAAK